MSLPLFIGISFPRLYPISFTAHLTLERFLIKPEWIESTVVHLNCCQGRISFGSERIFFLVLLCPLPKDIFRLLCLQISCKEKPIRCEQSDQTGKNRSPWLTSEAYCSHAEFINLKSIASAIRRHQQTLCNTGEGSNVQQGRADASTHCSITTFKIQPAPPDFWATELSVWKYLTLPTGGPVVVTPVTYLAGKLCRRL